MLSYLLKIRCKAVGFSAAVIFLAGCADGFLDREEARVELSGSPSPTSSLNEQSAFAFDLSRAYVTAARNATTVQDLLSSVVIFSAGSVVAGALGDTSRDALINRALIGLTAQQAGTRAVPGSAIKGIYTGARRMNCIGTMSSIGAQLLSNENARTRHAAQSATFGAINEVKISVREALVREIAEYSTVLEFFQGADPNDILGKLRADRVNENALRDYVTLLSRCLSDKASITSDTIPPPANPASRTQEALTGSTVIVQFAADPSRTTETSQNEEEAAAPVD